MLTSLLKLKFATLMVSSITLLSETSLYLYLFSHRAVNRNGSFQLEHQIVHVSYSLYINWNALIIMWQNVVIACWTEIFGRCNWSWDIAWYIARIVLVHKSNLKIQFWLKVHLHCCMKMSHNKNIHNITFIYSSGKE